MSFSFLFSFVFLLCSLGQAQFHKSSVNLFKQQTKAIQNALHTECPDVLSGDSTNALTQNINHPCLNPAPAKASP